MEIAGADYPERPERFEVNYQLLSLTKNRRLRVKVLTDETSPVPTATVVWPVANWLEREVFDMLYRGEDSQITSYLEKAVTTEMAGNLADVCPVGALLQKPQAFESRPWELRRVPGIDVMAEDPGQPRFFAYLSLFSFAMLMLVTANNLVQIDRKSVV